MAPKEEWASHTRQSACWFTLEGLVAMSKGPDHEWQAIVIKRTSRGDGCPFCAGQKVSVTNSLASLFPDIVAEWHPEKNAELTPDVLVAGSETKVWWRCPKGPDHEWQTILRERTYGASGCPFCGGRKVSVTNSLVSLFPDVAGEWHPTKNGRLTPDQVVPVRITTSGGSVQKGADHEWQASVIKRTAERQSCPFCKGMRVLVTNSLAALFPDIAREWHPAKNGNITPENVVAGSGKKAWWQCPKHPDHQWHATLVSRTTAGTGCPFCQGLKVSVSNSLAELFPSIAAQWHPARNGELTPDQVVAKSNKTVWWRCPKGPDHEWATTVVSRTSNSSGCPYCAGQRASVTNSLASRFPEIAAEWHHQRNGELRPDQVPSGSVAKVWWQCAVAKDHEWQAQVCSRTRLGQGCPRCNKGWTLQSIRAFVSSLEGTSADIHPCRTLPALPAERSARKYRKGKAFVKALATGRFPKEEIDKFVNGDPSLVDEFVQDPTQTLEALEASDQGTWTQKTTFSTVPINSSMTWRRKTNRNFRSSKPKTFWVRSAFTSSVRRTRKRSNSCSRPQSPRYGSTPTAMKMAAVAQAEAILRRGLRRAGADQGSLTSIARRKTSPFRTATLSRQRQASTAEPDAAALRRPRPGAKAGRQLVGHRGRQDARGRPGYPRGRQQADRRLLPEQRCRGLAGGDPRTSSRTASSPPRRSTLIGRTPHPGLLPQAEREPICRTATWSSTTRRSSSRTRPSGSGRLSSANRSTSSSWTKSTMPSSAPSRTSPSDGNW